MPGLARGRRVMEVCLLTLAMAGTAAAADPATFLVKPARAAVSARKLGLAVSLWRGVVAMRGDDDPSVLELAKVWTVAGEFDSAIEELERYRKALAEKGAFELTEAVMTVVGRVVALRRYPVKSMAPEELDATEVSWHGLAGDRRWAFVRDGQVRSGFPWLTIRDRPEMARYRPFYTERARPNASPTLVRTPSGGELDVADPALAAELGPGVYGSTVEPGQVAVGDPVELEP